MRKRFSLLSRTTLTAFLCATLTACAGSPRPSLQPPSRTPDPVVVQQVQTRLVCPAELDQSVPAQPTPSTDAKVATNPAGADYLARLVAWGQDLARRLTDASDTCHAAVAKGG